MRQSLILCLVLLSMVLGSIVLTSATAKGDASEAFSPADLHAFSALEPIDTHAHVFKLDPGFDDFLQKLHLHLLDIVVANKDDATFPNLQTKKAAAEAFVRQSGGKTAPFTSFYPLKFFNPTFSGGAAPQINQGFSQGGGGRKIW